MKKNGFTLVELLAVIVILALIALIATPIVMNVVANSQKSAFSSSLNGIKNAIEADYGDRELEIINANDVVSYVYQNGVLYFVDAEGNRDNKPIPISGGINGGNGIGQVDENGNVIVKIYNHNYCGKIGGRTSKIDVADCDGLEACKKACGL